MMFFVMLLYYNFFQSKKFFLNLEYVKYKKKYNNIYKINYNHVLYTKIVSNNINIIYI